MSFFHDLSERRANRLDATEYELTSWAARTWKTYSAHRLSVALHVSVAWEIVSALGIATATDPRGL